MVTTQNTIFILTQKYLHEIIHTGHLFFFFFPFFSLFIKISTLYADISIVQPINLLFYIIDTLLSDKENNFLEWMHAITTGNLRSFQVKCLLMCDLPVKFLFYSRKSCKYAIIIIFISINHALLMHALIVIKRDINVQFNAIVHWTHRMPIKSIFTIRFDLWREKISLSIWKK